VIVAHQDFRFFATQNHATGYAGRFVLPLSLRNRMLEVQIADFEKDELALVIRGCSEASGYDLPQHDADRIAQVYEQLKTSKHRMTLRDLVKWTCRKHKFSEAPWGRIGLTMFESLLHHKQSHRAVGSTSGHSVLEMEALEVEKVFSDAFNPGHAINHAIPTNVSIKPCENGKCIFSSGGVSVEFQGINLEASFLLRDKKQPPEVFQRALVCIAFAVKASEPVLLVGPSCFKSLLVRTWAEITGRHDMQTVSMLPDSDSVDLVGQIQPYSLCDLVSAIISSLEVIESRVSAAYHSRTASKAKTEQERSDYRMITSMLKQEATSVSSLRTLFADFLNELQSTQNKSKPHDPSALDQEIDSSLTANVLPMDENGWAQDLWDYPDSDKVSDSRSPLGSSTDGHNSDSKGDWEEESDSGSSRRGEAEGELIADDSPFDEVSDSHSNGATSPFVGIDASESWSEATASDEDPADLEGGDESDVNTILDGVLDAGVPLLPSSGSQENAPVSSRAVIPRVGAIESVFGTKVKKIPQIRKGLVLIVIWAPLDACQMREGECRTPRR
jgi:hypothetical protein